MPRGVKVEDQLQDGARNGKTENSYLQLHDCTKSQNIHQKYCWKYITGRSLHTKVLSLMKIIAWNSRCTFVTRVTSDDFQQPNLYFGAEGFFFCVNILFVALEVDVPT